MRELEREDQCSGDEGAVSPLQDGSSGLSVFEDSIEAGFNAAFVLMAINVGGAVIAGEPTRSAVGGSGGKVGFASPSV